MHEQQCMLQPQSQEGDDYNRCAVSWLTFRELDLVPSTKNLSVWKTFKLQVTEN